MKKRFFVAILVIVLAFGAVASLAACGGGLQAPANIAVRGDDLSWDRVQGATSYAVTVTGEGYSDSGVSDDGFYKLTFTEPGVYTITVVAVDADGNRGEEGKLVYTFKQALATPSAPSYDPATGIVSWEAIDNAVSYSLRVWNTVEDKLIETVSVEGTSYELDAEKYGATGAYEISVAAIAAEDGVYSDSAYGPAYSLVNGARLSVPEISSVSTRIRWAAVTGASGYDVRLVNRDSGTEYSYHVTTTSTSTTASVAISSFGVEETGVYDILLRATGDGVVYTDSEWSEANPDYVVYKLADFAEDDEISIGCVMVEGRPSQTLTFNVSAAQAANVEQYTVSALAIDGDGETGTALQRTFTVDLDGEQDGWTVTEQADGTLTYTVEIDRIFFDEEGNVLDQQEDEFALRNYGRLYRIQVQAKRDDSNGVIDGAAAVATGEYISYIVPEFDGSYKVTNAGELAFMHFAPDADFRLEANIDFDGYMWKTVESFSGELSNLHNYIVTDIVYQTDGDNLAFVGELAAGGAINDIVIVNAEASADQGKAVALLVAVNNGTVAGSFVSGTVEAGASTAGGLVAVNNGTVRTSAAYADVSGSVAGGLAAINSANAAIHYSSAFGTVSAVYADEETAQYAACVGKVEAGGFVAENSGWITNGSYEGNVTVSNGVAGNTVRAGGFAAFNDGVIQNSYAGANYSNNQQLRNTVKADSSTTAEGGIAAGGFVGVNVSGGEVVGETQILSGTIQNCYSNVRAEAAVAGGFVGVNDGSVAYSYSIGGISTVAVTANGFAGSGNGTFEGCVFYDADLRSTGSADGVTRVERTGTDFNTVGTAIAELLDGHGIVKTDNAANPVLVGLQYVATSDRHLYLSPGQAVDLTVWSASADGTVIETVFENGGDEIRVFGDTSDGESVGRGAGEYVIKTGSGNFVAYVAMTVSR